MNVLFDDRKVEFNETTVELVKKVSEDYSAREKQIGNGKAAILMKSLTDYARGRQFELLTEKRVSSELNVFTDEDKAVNWLTS